MNSQFPACLTPQAGSLSIVSRFTCPPPPLLVPTSFAATTLVTRGVPRNGWPGCSARRQDGGLWSPVQQWFPGLCAPTVPLRDPSKPVVWGPVTCFPHLRRPQIMASPAKADSVLASSPAPDALPLGAAEVGNSGLGVQIPTGPPHRDSSVTPPSATCEVPVVLPDQPEDSSAPESSTYSPQDNIRAVNEWKAEEGTKLLDLNTLQWDYHMQFGQIRKLNGEVWKGIMRSFATSPPMQPGNVVVIKHPSMSTPVTRM